MARDLVRSQYIMDDPMHAQLCRVLVQFLQERGGSSLCHRLYEAIAIAIAIAIEIAFVMIVVLRAIAIVCRLAKMQSS